MCTRHAVPSLLLALAAPMPAAEPATDNSSVVLKVEVLASPQTVLSRAEAATPSLAGGAVAGGHKFVFKGKDAQILTLAGQDLTLAADGPNITCEGKGVPRTSQRLRPPAGGILKLALPQEPFSLAITTSAQAQAMTTLWCHAGQVWAGTVAGERIAWFDDNLDGRLTLAADTYGTGKSRVFAPFAKLILLGGKPYEVDLDTFTMKVKPFAGPTKALTCTSGKGPLIHAVIGSPATGLFATIDAPTATVQVPDGAYQLQYGLALSTNGQPLAIVSGKGLKPVQVDKPATMSWGGPYHLSFAPTLNQDRLQIEGRTLRFTGAAGEEYLGFSCDRPPEVYLRKEGGRNLLVGNFKEGQNGELGSFDTLVNDIHKKLPANPKNESVETTVVVSLRLEGFGTIQGESRLTLPPPPKTQQPEPKKPTPQQPPKVPNAPRK